MDGDQTRSDSDQTAAPKSAESTNGDRRNAGLDDPRAVEILTTEHWSLLSTRSLGYQEIFSRATLFTGILSATVVALALLAQATNFGRTTLSLALLLLSVALFIGVLTFLRSVAINYEDARWVEGMNLLRSAYLRMIPELEPFFVTAHESDAERRALAHGSPQRVRNLASSLTTTSGVVAALNSVLAGSLASDLGALFRLGFAPIAILGLFVSLVSAVLHVRYAASFRRRHAPSADS